MRSHPLKGGPLKKAAHCRRTEDESRAKNSEEDGRRPPRVTALADGLAAFPVGKEGWARVLEKVDKCSKFNLRSKRNVWSSPNAGQEKAETRLKEYVTYGCSVKGDRWVTITGPSRRKTAYAQTVAGMGIAHQWLVNQKNFRRYWALTRYQRYPDAERATRTVTVGSLRRG